MFSHLGTLMGLRAALSQKFVRRNSNSGDR